MAKARIWVAALALILLLGGVWIWRHHKAAITGAPSLSVRYGVTPFQDSALPVVADHEGWYRRDGLDVKLVSLGWSDVPLALASKSIDVALYNFDSYMAVSEQLQKGGVEVIFYAPLYVWNGAAILVHGDRGLQPAGDLSHLQPEDRKRAVRRAMEQLRGKKIGITEGTTFEQTVLDALRVAGMDPKKDVRLVHARPEDNLAAFLSGDLDAFSAGLTERVQAKRHGATELVIGPDASLPAIDGIIATRDFAEQHPKEMQKLVDLWFETIAYMETDIAGRSAIVRDYLRGKASIDYSADEYAIAWTFQYFPDSRQSAREAFLTPGNIYFWKTIWDSNSQALLSQKKISEAVPESYFWGEKTLQ